MDLTLAQIWQILTQDYAILLWGTPLVFVGLIFIIRQIFYYLFSIDTIVWTVRDLHGSVDELVRLQKTQIEMLQNQYDLIFDVSERPIEIRLVDDYIEPVNHFFNLTSEINKKMEQLVKLWK